MSQRIAWIGPWNQKSAIAAFGQFVVAELAARGHAVTIFRSETGEILGLPPLPAPGTVLPLPSDPLGFGAENFDGVICNVGDHYGHHGAVPEFLEAVPCLAIFHDGLIFNLAAGWSAYRRTAQDAALHRVVAATYGGDVPAEHCPFPSDLAEIAAKWPMAEWLARYCAGVITHSDVWTPRLGDACPGAVTVLPLAYPELPLPAPKPLGRRVVAATIGHINRNKCPDAIIEAIGRDPLLRERCEYRLIGPIEPAERERLTALARSLGPVRLHCTGWLDEADLRAAVSEVDVIACLRNPVLEGGSASLVTAMLSARPTLVSDHGVYAEVPGDLVLPCAPGREAEGVAAHLRGILEDPAAAQAMGQRARRYALKTFSATRYVDGLLPALAAATAAAPAVGAANRLGRILGNFGLPPDHQSVGRIAARLCDALGERPDDAAPPGD